MRDWKSKRQKSAIPKITQQFCKDRRHILRHKQLFIKMRRSALKVFITTKCCISFKCYEIQDIDRNIEVVCIHLGLLVTNNVILELSLFSKIPNFMRMQLSYIDIWAFLNKLDGFNFLLEIRLKCINLSLYLSQSREKLYKIGRCQIKMGME